MIRLKVKKENGEDVAVMYLEADGGEVNVKDDISAVKPRYTVEVGKVGQLSAVTGAPVSIDIAMPALAETNIHEIAKNMNIEMKRSMMNGGMM